ncbi:MULTISPECIES: saccharopine dehydrogenase NADP-binding domain-containing protein [Kribbella]|uniref:Saccharopine dehydrogenase NADP-binding domain-containing protein n=1 Tax=Kribbella karoonensis TaxID=324851 RepID=A0ABN2EGL2_9ACTN
MDEAIAVYGGNGYQGKLVLAELVARGIRPIPVGRDRARLSAAALAVGLDDPEIRVAALEDEAALVAAFEDVEAVINCAGPFTGTGRRVIRAAAAARTPYVDTAGEQEYVKSVFDTFAGAPVSVVPAANDGCVPVDLLAHLMAGEVRRTDRIVLTHVIAGGGGPSRGSLRSALGTLDSLVSGGFTYVDGEWRTAVPASVEQVTLPGHDRPTDVVRLPLCEVVTIPRHVAVGNVESVVEAVVGERLRTPIPPELIETLPDGPSAEARAGQRFTYVVDVWRAGEIVSRGVVEGVDTYGTTAVIAVEAARRLGAGGAPRGVLAPANAFSAADFLNFLGSAGLRWSMRP